MKSLHILLTGLAALPLASCLSHPAPPAAPYHAVGTEPFWDLLIDDRNMTFRVMDGPLVVETRPKVIVGIAGETYPGTRISVNIVHGSCNDGMSDRTFPDSVQVNVDGKAFKGCGGL